MSDTKLTIAAVVFGFLIFGAGIAASVSVWSECRSGGHSFLYCMKLISR